MQKVKKRILIVDDTPSIHEDFKKIFRLESLSSNKKSPLQNLESELFGTKEIKVEKGAIDLVCAFQGEEALELIKKSLEEKRPFHLAFVDMRMPPGWDGIKTIEEIAKIDPDIHFVICTAYSDKSLDDFLALDKIQDRLLLIKKPFDHLEIILTSNALTEKWELNKIAQQKREELEKQVEERTALIESTNRLTALGEMSAGIAHEINNPLTIIQANSTIIRNLAQAKNWDEERIEKAVSQINKTVQRIAKIIDGLKTFSRDGSHLAFEKYHLTAVLNDTLEICQKKLENSDIRLIKDVPDSLSSLELNKVQMSQVFLNLILNAKDALDELGGEKWVQVQARESDNEFVISFIDSGKGIPEELQEKIMTPFFTTKALGKGTGLGLSISKGIIAAHQGELKLDTSSPHTKFDIILPKKRKTL